MQVLGNVFLLSQQEVRLAAARLPVVDGIDACADAAPSPFTRIESDVAETQALLREIIDDVVSVVISIFTKRNLNLNPRAFVRIVTHFGKPMRASGAAVHVSQRNN